jgi:prevent-host-death family protein
MKMSEKIKPISYFKAHAAELINDLPLKKTYIITSNGEAKAVLQDIKSYEEMQESLILLKMLAQSTASLQKGRVKTAKKAFAAIRNTIKSEK